MKLAESLKHWKDTGNALDINSVYNALCDALIICTVYNALQCTVNNALFAMHCVQCIVYYE